MRSRRAALRISAGCLAIAAAIGLYFLLGSSGSAVAPKAQSGALRSKRPVSDTQLAVRLSARMGDPNPSEIVVVSTTREKAQHAISPGEEVIGGAPPDTPVRIFAMHGEFTDPGPIPPGARPPRGTWLTVSVDAATGRTEELSLGDRRPELATLGAIHQFRLTSR